MPRGCIYGYETVAKSEFPRYVNMTISVLQQHADLGSVSIYADRFGGFGGMSPHTVLNRSYAAHDSPYAILAVKLLKLSPVIRDAILGLGLCSLAGLSAANRPS